MALGNSVGMAKTPPRPRTGKQFRKETKPLNQPMGLPFLYGWRKKRGFTQEALGERAGFTHGMISQLENGEVNYTQPTLQSLAWALECEPWELLAYDPQVTNSVAQIVARALTHGPP